MATYIVFLFSEMGNELPDVPTWNYRRGDDVQANSREEAEQLAMRQARPSERVRVYAKLSSRSSASQPRWQRGLRDMMRMLRPSG